MTQRALILTIVLSFLSLFTTAQPATVVAGLPADSVFADAATLDSLAAIATDSTAAVDAYAPAVQRNFNALRYSLDTYHSYRGDRMSRAVDFFEIGGGIMAVNDDHTHNPDPFFMMNVRLGRQYNRFSSLRLGISGGLGFIPQAEKNTFYNSINARVAVEADYLYSLTSHLLGYRPDRALDVSGFVGVGAGYSQLFKSNKDDWISEFNTRRTTAFARAGFQLKFFAGAQAAMALEPYAYVSTGGIDLVRPEFEMYNYRIGYGLDLSFIQYLGRRLSLASEAGDFRRVYQRRQRYFDSDVPRALRHHPLIVGLQTGVAGVSGDGRTFMRSAGVGQTLYLGWWMSPALGVRTQFNTENMKWQDYSDNTLKNYIAYRSGAVDLMINPLGFTRYGNWDAPAGLSLLVGYEGAYASRKNGNEFPAFGYRGGASLWVRLANGTKATVEPMYAILTHKNDNLRASIDYITRLKVGLEMTIGGERDTLGDAAGRQGFPLGYFVGAAVGRNFTPRYYQETSREREALKSALFFAGYEYSELHGVRLGAEFMTDVFYHNNVRDRQQRWVATLGYRLNASNLLRGWHPRRRWHVSANIGPAVAFGDGHTDFGADVGLQLDYRLGKHFSLFLAQQLYWMPNGLWDTDQTTDANLTSSFNIGLMYHFEQLLQPTINVVRTTAGAIATAGTAVGNAVVTAGAAVGKAGAVVGNAVVTAGAAVGKAGAAVGKAVGKGGAAVGNAIGSLGVATGKTLATMARNITTQQGRPLFVEYALGYQHILHMPTDGIDTWEPQIQLGIGWWPLPAIGLRAGADLIRGSSKESQIDAANGTFTRYDKLRLSYLYADLMVNPLGLAPNYNWQSAAGVNLIAGRTLINLASRNMEERYWRYGWRLGTQLWTRLDHGLRLSVEPMFSLYKCDPQSDDPANYTYRDHRDIFSLKVGLTMLMQQPGKTATAAGSHPRSRRPRWFVGIGGGLHFNKDDYRLSGGGTNSNMQLLAGYRLWKNTAIRLGEEITFDHFMENRNYTLTSGPLAGTQKSAMANVTYRFLFSSLTGQYDLMGLFNDTPQRRWELNFILGGTLSYYLNESANIIGENQDHTVNTGLRNSPMNFNTTVGLMVGYRLSNHLSAYMNHHLYIYSFGHPQWVHYTKQIWSISGYINTFNAGLMVHF